jgi:hypothetical protein
VKRVIDAWDATGAFDDGAELMFVTDRDDPEQAAYEGAIEPRLGVRGARGAGAITRLELPAWQALVPKLNRAAMFVAGAFAVGFAGDDHRPRTRGWARAYLDALRAGAGIVHGDDGYQHENLPTEWAMRGDIVRALGRMIPAPVAHLYCDNSIRDLGRATGLLRYLPDVSIEHMHPAAGKATSDEQYERVNGSEQYRADRRAYREWTRHGLAEDVLTINRMGEMTA